MIGSSGKVFSGIQGSVLWGSMGCRYGGGMRLWGIGV